MDKRRNPLRDPAPFRAWLESQPARSIVGVPCDGRECPLANYIRQAREAGFVNVSTRVAFVVDNQYFAVPPWADLFIGRVDGERGRIAARRALELLDAVELELGGA